MTAARHGWSGQSVLMRLRYRRRRFPNYFGVLYSATPAIWFGYATLHSSPPWSVIFGVITAAIVVNFVWRCGLLPEHLRRRLSTEDEAGTRA